MAWMFLGSKFSGVISKWNVSNVTSTTGMFDNSIFNGDISDWNLIRGNNRNLKLNHEVFDFNHTKALLNSVVANDLELVGKCISSCKNLLETNSRGLTAVDLSRSEEIRSLIESEVLLLDVDSESLSDNCMSL